MKYIERGCLAIIGHNDEWTRVQRSNNSWLFLVLTLEASKICNKLDLRADMFILEIILTSDSK